MFATESALDQIALVSRILAYKQSHGQELPSALAELRSTLSGEYSNSIDALENILAGDDSVALVGYEAGPLRMFNTLASIIRQEKGDASRLFIGTRDGLRDAMAVAREYWHEFNAIFIYVITVLAVTIIVMGTFSIKVLPTISTVFSGVNQQLPAFTKFLISNYLILPALMAILMLFVIGFVACSYHIRKKVAQFFPLHSVLRRIPGLRGLNAVYSYYLFIQYVRALTSAGVKPDAAVRHAEELSKIDQVMNDDIAAWRQAIVASASMGVLEDEIGYQCQRYGSLFNRKMIETRDFMTVAIQFFIGIFIGALLIAMYLPIFMLGSVV